MIEEFSLAMSEVAPLVGFHGKVDAYGLTGLGLIMVDTITPACQKGLYDYNLDNLKDKSTAEIAEIIEDSISTEESERAKMLEALLRIHLNETYKEDKQVLINKINDLVNMKMISTTKEGKPKDMKDVEEILNRLATIANGEALDLKDYDL